MTFSLTEARLNCAGGIRLFATLAIAVAGLASASYAPSTPQPTTTAVTGFEISPIFNCYVTGLSGGAKCFQNSDGSFSITYTGAGAMQNLAVQNQIYLGLSGRGALCVASECGSSVIPVDGTVYAGKGVVSVLNGVQASGQTYSTLPTCASGTQGRHVTVTDSTVNTWGTAITTGGGSNIVGAFCNGTNYTVEAK